MTMFPLDDSQQYEGNRTRVEILASILTVASYGALKTHIMYKANLSHRQLEKYLAFLEERDMITRVLDGSGGSTYRITDKGFGFLRDYSHVTDYFTLKPD